MSLAPFVFQKNPGRAQVRRGNTVLNGHALRRHHDPGFLTTLTLKSLVRGVAEYRTPRSVYRLEPDRVAVFNHGQTYALDMRPEWRSETLAVFFQPGFLEHVAAARACPEAALLEDPAVVVPALDFCERMHPRSGRLAAALAALHAEVRAPGFAPLHLEAPFYSLAEAMLELRGETRAEIDALPAARAATREELYRRLHHARDYLESCLSADVSLGEAAQVACLSPYHFQRSFRGLFGETPARFVQRRRLERARELLAGSPRDVASIALSVGYASPGSFSTLFRREFGVSPRGFREDVSRSARSEK